MPLYPVTDKSTGQRWNIEADTPERAREIALTRRQAKAGTLQYEKPPEAPSLTGFAKEFVSAPYVDPQTGKPREVDFGRAIAEPFQSAWQGVTATPKALMQGRLPTGSEALQTGMAGLTAFAPEILPIMSGANVLAEAIYGATGSPLAAGITQQVAGLATPSMLKKVGSRLTGNIAAKDAAAAAERTEQEGKLAAQAEKVNQAKQRVTGAEEALKGTEADIERTGAQKTLAERARTPAEINESLAQVEKARAQGEEAKIASRPMMAPKTTTLQFGEKFVPPDFAKPDEFKGYYGEAKEGARQAAKQMYNEALNVAAGTTAPRKKLAEGLQSELESRGIAAEIVPTQAERFAKSAVDVLGDDEQAYRSVKDLLTQEQYEYLASGKGSTPGAPLSGVPAIPHDVAKIIGTALQSGKGGAQIQERRLQEILEGGRVPLATDIPSDQAIILRQRLNGAIRAAESSKRFDISRDLKTYRSHIEQALPPEVMTALKKADRNYAENYIQYFGPDAELNKIVERKNPAEVFRAIVPKNDPAQVAQAMKIMSPEGQQALRGAFYHHLYDTATTREGPNWQKLISEYDSYSPEVKQALLGNSKPAWDQMIGNIHKLNADAQISSEYAVKALQQARANVGVTKRRLLAAEQAQSKALGRREALGRQYDMSVKNLDKQERDMAKMQAEFEQLGKPVGHGGTGFLASRKRMLAVFGTLDVAKWALGMGQANIIKWAIGDFATLYVLSNPNIMSKGTGMLDSVVRTAANYMSTRFNDPLRTQKALAMFNLAQHLDEEGSRGK